MSVNQHTNFPAVVRFLTEAEGGRSTDPLPGICPQMQVGHLYTSCMIYPVQEANILGRGETIEVSIIPMFYEHVGTAMSQMSDFQLYEGSHIIATGRFLNKR
jgi:translation elongation factor EF-Tu-like GTPase